MYELFIDFIETSLQAGQSYLAMQSREMLAARAGDVFDGLDYDDDRPFLEPLLFAWCTASAPRSSAEQVAFGYLDDESKLSEVKVSSDENGVVYLPRLGYYSTRLADRVLRCSWSPARREIHLSDGGILVPYSHEPPYILGSSGPELMLHNSALLDRLYAGAGGQVEAVEAAGIARRQAPKVAVALDILRALVPRYHRCVTACTRRIVLFRSDRVNSFAAPAAHGTAFLNTREDDDEVFFIEDLAHQCGHIIFNAVTCHPAEYLAVNPDTPLKAYVRRNSESRTVLQAFHGIFTEAVMLLCLDRCHAEGVFEGKQAWELLGRMAFILRRFGSDLGNLNRPGLFTPLGEWVHVHLVSLFKTYFDAHWARVRKVDVSNQPYAFDYRRFVEKNNRGSEHARGIVE